MIEFNALQIPWWVCFDFAVIGRNPRSDSHTHGFKTPKADIEQSLFLAIAEFLLISLAASLRLFLFGVADFKL